MSALRSRRKTLALAAAVLLFGALSACSSSSGACVAPIIEVAPREAAPGEAVTVTVTHAFETCNDQGLLRRERVIPSIDLVLQAAGTTFEFGSVEVADDGTASLVAPVPAEAAPGSATVSSPTVPHSSPVTLTITG